MEWETERQSGSERERGLKEREHGIKINIQFTIVLQCNSKGRIAL